MPLAATLIPLIPGLVSGIMSVIDAIRGHGETPEELKLQLDDISADLKVIVAKVQAVELPAKSE